MNLQTVSLAAFFIITAFRLFFAASLNLTPDETYYWFWSEHPALSYFDHPPMVSYLIKSSTWLFGNHPGSVRLPALLMGVGSTLLVYALGHQVFKSKNAGLLSAAILNSLLIFSAGMVIITPDTPQMFFWLLTLYFACRAVHENKTAHWILTGASLGFGLLSKYTMVLFLPGFFLFLLLTPQVRHTLFSWKPWTALFLAFLIFTPVIVWNYQHEWISFLFQLHHGTDSRESPGLRYLFEFLGGQAGIFSPLIFAGFFWALWKAFKIGRKKELYPFALLFWSVFPVFGFFIYESLHTKIEANWAGFAQTGSIILLGGFLNQKIRDRDENSKIVPLTVLMISLGLILTALVHLQPYFKLIPLSVERDRTNDLIGWDELSRIKAKFPEAGSLPVLTTSHTLVGEASFYLQNPSVYQWGAPHRITDLTQANPLPATGSTFLLMTYDDDQFSDEANALFSRITPLADIPVYYPKSKSGRLIRTYHFFKGENFLGLPLRAN
jgi:undecaprenyl-diphosphatase